MSSLAVSGIVFGCGVAGAFVGMLIHHRLPDHHISAESKDVIKLAMGLIGTMTALVLGLLIASAKGSFDAQRDGVARLAANAVVLDRLLAFYGQEARPTRELLRDSVADMLRRAGPEGIAGLGRTGATGSTEGRYEELYVQTLALEPKTDAQRTLQSQALKLVADTGQMRSFLFAQERGTAIPTPFLAVLVVWLTLLLGNFGLLAPGNLTTLLSLAVCSLSAASAVFLILELDHPFYGVIRISDEPLRGALAQLGR